MDNQSFSIVEDDGFIAYSAALNPQYSMPGRMEVSEMLVPEYDRVRAIIQAKLDTAAIVNFTSDLWTEDTTRATFISFVECVHSLYLSVECFINLSIHLSHPFIHSFIHSSHSIHSFIIFIHSQFFQIIGQIIGQNPKYRPIPIIQ